MKKIIALLIAIAMVLSMAACSNNKDNDTTPSVSETDKTTSSTESKVEENNDKNLLRNTYKVPMKNIYIDTPKFQEIEQAYTELFIVHASKYVAITAARRSTASDAKAAHEEAFKEFIPNMQNYEGGVNSIKIEKDEVVTINNLEVYSFEGKINYGTDTKYDGYAVGYSFIMDGIPCEIIGSVIDENQSKALIDEIHNIVDEMIKTVRAEA